MDDQGGARVAAGRGPIDRRGRRHAWSRGGGRLLMGDGTAAAEIGIDAGELEVSASVTITFGIEP